MEWQWTPDREAKAKSKRAALASMTSGRFVGEYAPSANSGWIAWITWWIRMLTIHLFQRLAIVPGDLPSHDWHHEHPVSWDWANHAYARLESGLQDASRRPAYTELWGVKQTIGLTFHRLSALPADARLGESVTPQERHAVLSSM